MSGVFVSVGCMCFYTFGHFCCGITFKSLKLHFRFVCLKTLHFNTITSVWLKVIRISFIMFEFKLQFKIQTLKLNTKHK